MKTTTTQKFKLPISLCKRVELVARKKKLTFNKAVSFLLEKVNSPISFCSAR
jgi:hypothetical protein